MWHASSIGVIPRRRTNSSSRCPRRGFLIKGWPDVNSREPGPTRSRPLRGRRQTGRRRCLTSWPPGGRCIAGDFQHDGTRPVGSPVRRHHRGPGGGVAHHDRCARAGQTQEERLPVQLMPLGRVEGGQLIEQRRDGAVGIGHGERLRWTHLPSDHSGMSWSVSANTRSPVSNCTAHRRAGSI